MVFQKSKAGPHLLLHRVLGKVSKTQKMLTNSKSRLLAKETVRILAFFVNSVL